MAYNRNNNRTPRAHLVTAADVGNHLTLRIRNGQPGGRPIYVSGLVKAVTPMVVVITRTVHPTGPWDKWQSHDVDVDIAHNRILARA